MTTPTALTWPPTIGHVKALREIPEGDTLNDAALEMATAAAVSYAEQHSPFVIPLDPDDPATDYTAAPSAVYGAILLASRLFDRRTTSAGIVGMPDVGQMQLRSSDPDIARHLGIDSHRRPRVG